MVRSLGSTNGPEEGGWSWCCFDCLVLGLQRAAGMAAVLRWLPEMAALRGFQGGVSRRTSIACSASRRP